MDKLLPWFPLSGSVIPGQPRSLILTLVIYVIACGILGVLRTFLGWIPLVGWLIGLVLSLLALYCVAGMVIAVLRYLSKL